MPQNKKAALKYQSPDKASAQDSAQGGNVFIYIFLAVFLFGALMFTINRATQTTSNKISTNTAKAHAIEILDYAQRIRNGLERVQSKGVGEADISFENSYISGYEHTPVAPDKGKIFHPLGGKVVYKPPNPAWLDSSYSAGVHYGELYFPRSTCADIEYNTCTNSGLITKADFVLFIFYLKKEICIEINKLTGLGSSPVPIQDAGRYTAINQRYQGVFTGTAGSMDLNYYGGQIGGCITEGSGPDLGYGFFYVLQQRN